MDAPAVGRRLVTIAQTIVANNPGNAQSVVLEDSSAPATIWPRPPLLAAPTETVPVELLARNPDEVAVKGVPAGAMVTLVEVKPDMRKDEKK